MEITAYLDWYTSITDSQTFTVTISECIKTSWSVSELSDQIYYM